MIGRLLQECSIESGMRCTKLSVTGATRVHDAPMGVPFLHNSIIYFTYRTAEGGTVAIVVLVAGYGHGRSRVVMDEQYNRIHICIRYTCDV